MKISKWLLLALGATLLLGCTSEEKLKEQLATILKDNPKILTEAIEKNPAEFISALQNAASVASMILTTEALVTDVPKEEKAPAAPDMGGMGGMM